MLLSRTRCLLILLLGLFAWPAQAEPVVEPPTKPSVPTQPTAWQTIREREPAYQNRGAREQIVAGLLIRSADGRLQVGRNTIAPDSAKRLTKWIGHAVALRTKPQASYRHTGRPPLMVGAVRPVDLLLRLTDQLNALTHGSPLQKRAARRALAQADRATLERLQQIASGTNKQALPAAAVLRDRGVVGGLFLELTLTRQAATAPAGAKDNRANDTPAAMTGRLIRLSGDAMPLAGDPNAWSFVCTVSTPAGEALPVPVTTPDWTPDPTDPNLLATVSVANLFKPIPQGVLTPGLIPVQMTLVNQTKTSKVPHTVLTATQSVRLLSQNTAPSLTQPELARQAEWIDRLGSQGWLEREQARLLLERVQYPAIHLLERAIDDADPQIAATAQQLRWWYASAITFLGISYAPHPQGVRVTAVLLDGPAYRAGVRPGDLMLSFDGKMFRLRDNLTLMNRLIRSLPAGKQVPLLILRGKNKLAMIVTLGRIEPGEAGFQ